MFIMLTSLFLLLIVLLSTPAAGKTLGCDTSQDVQRTIELVGYPVCKINITWKSWKQRTDTPVIHYVYYYETSEYNLCSCQTFRFNQSTYPHCTRQSSKPGEVLHCILDKKNINGLKIAGNMHSICIVIVSSFQNRTWYSFNDCTGPMYINGPHCQTACPVPDRFHVQAFKTRALTVIYDAPSCIRDKVLLDIAFRIKYRPANQESSNSGNFEIINIADLSKQFLQRNNQYVVENLIPATRYEVKMCCFFRTISSSRCPLSTSYFASTLEEAPSRPPIVTSASLAKSSLSFKFKIPPYGMQNGKLITYGFEVWRADGNCSTWPVDSKAFTKKNLTAEDVKREDINCTFPLRHDGNYCFRVKVRNSAAWSPWSDAYFLQDHVEPKTKTSPTVPPVPTTSIFALVAGAVIIILVFIGIVWFLMKSRTRPPNRQASLPELRNIFEDISTTTTDTEDEHDAQYAVPFQQEQA